MENIMQMPCQEFAAECTKKSRAAVNASQRMEWQLQILEGVLELSPRSEHEANAHEIPVRLKYRENFQYQ